MVMAVVSFEREKIRQRAYLLCCVGGQIYYFASWQALNAVHSF